MGKREWDYVIVGGGTAGCVVAARLTEDPGTRVLLLEAGGECPAIFRVPLAGLRRIHDFSWGHRTDPQPGLDQRQISLPVGKVVGGSSSINAMMYFRGARASYDRWEELGNADWSFAKLLPYFKKSETWEGTPSEYHGDHGPVHVCRPRHVAPFSKAFVDACVEQGMPYLEDFNGIHEEGAGFFSVMQRRGRRDGAGTAYLAPARQRPGLTVQTRVLVRRLIFEGSRAAGVEYESRDGAVMSAFAARDVILAAGALNSPKILMLSGVGPADQLRRIGIKPLLDLPGVGENLRDHVRIPVIFEAGRRSPADKRYWMKAAAIYALRQKGVLASNCCESGAMIRTDASKREPDLQLVTHFQTSLHPQAVDIQLVLLRSSGTGWVRVVSRDPRVPPLLHPRYLSEAHAIETALRGVQLVRKIAGSKMLRKFPLGAEILPGCEVQDERAVEEHCRKRADTAFHPVGTCKMGTDSMAVVDAKLQVRGLEKLRVVDASVMPDIPAGNTCAAVLAIAERAADLIRCGRA